MVVFHRSLSDSKSPQVTRTFLTMVTVIIDVVVWTVSTHPPIFNRSTLFSKLLGTVASARITVSITIRLEVSEMRKRIKNIQIPAFLRSTRTLRRVLKIWRAFLSLKLEWQSTSRSKSENIIIIIIIIITENLNTGSEHIQSGYWDGLWHRKMCHASNEKGKTVNEGRNRTTKPGKKSERSGKRKITCTKEYWKQTRSKKRRWKKK